MVWRNGGKLLENRFVCELSKYYPSYPDKSKIIAYMWARTILSEGPGIDGIPIEIPLIRSMWLARKKNKLVAIRWARDNSGKIKTKVITKDYCDGSTRRIHQPLMEIFTPLSPSEVEKGTVSRSSATCPITNYTTPASNVRSQFGKRNGGANDARLFAVAYTNPSKKGRQYRLPNHQDDDFLTKAICKLEKIIKSNDAIVNMIPNEELPYLRSIFNINLLGVSSWGELFTKRQLLALTTLVGLIDDITHELADEYEKDLALGIKVCLAFILDKMADINCSLATWQLNAEIPAHLFTRQAIGIVWDFCESCPVSGTSGSITSGLKRTLDGIKNIYTCITMVGTVGQESATELPIPDGVANLFFTDPPYYDAVPYADLSDFFYVWLKRSLGSEFPELFKNELTPKHEEIVQLAERNPKYSYKTHENYEILMTEALKEARRVLNHSGLGVVVFAHKSTSGWEAQLQAMINAGWVITASWPIDTEMRNRLRAMDSATLSSSIHLVCRPRENPDGSLRNDDVGDWRDLLSELPKRIHEWMPRLAKEGVVGADAIFSCLGPALEIYSRYSSVEKASGEKVELKEYLEEVWAAVSREALNMIFEGADASGFEEDARLTAMWLWTMRTAVNGNNSADGNDSQTKSLPGYSLEYDAARKIAQGLGAHLEKLSHLVEIKGNTAMLLSAGARTRYLFGKDAGEAPKGRKKKIKQQKFEFMLEVKNLESESGDWAGDLSGRPGSTVLDQLHQSMILFGAGRGEAVKRFLVEEGVGRNPLFWRLAQALSALYPTGTDEKRWVDGVLARKKGLGL